MHDGMSCVTSPNELLPGSLKSRDWGDPTLSQRPRYRSHPKWVTPTHQGPLLRLHSNIRRGRFDASAESRAIACLQVEARHIGDFRFKGMTGVHGVMQINNARYSGRHFPLTLPTAKAELVSRQRVRSHFEDPRTCECVALTQASLAEQAFPGFRFHPSLGAG